jgi:3-oxoacyl-[acyl-carrier protein] reductase
MTVVIGSSDPVSAAVASSLDVPVVDIGSPIPPGSDVIVIVVGSSPGPELTDAHATAEADWSRLAEAPMQRTLKALQRAHLSMGGRDGRIVVILPTIGMAGSAQLVPYTTALEGIRTMTKSAARQWATNGIAVNIVAAPLRLFAPTTGASTAHLTAPAVDDDDSGLIETVVEATTFLLRQDIKVPVGATIVADGGSVMLP